MKKMQNIYNNNNKGNNPLTMIRRRMKKVALLGQTGGHPSPAGINNNQTVLSYQQSEMDLDYDDVYANNNNEVLSGQNPLHLHNALPSLIGQQIDSSSSSASIMIKQCADNKIEREIKQKQTKETLKIGNDYLPSHASLLQNIPDLEISSAKKSTSSAAEYLEQLRSNTTDLTSSTNTDIVVTIIGFHELRLPREDSEEIYVDADSIADASSGFSRWSQQQEPSTRTKNAAANDAERKVLSHRRYVVVVSSSRVWDPGGVRQN